MSAFTWLNIEKYNKRPNKYFIILMILFAAFSCLIFAPKKNRNVFFCIGCSKFLYQIIALFGWSLFLIWLHLTIVTSWFSSLKFLCLKKTMFLWWICIVRQFSWTFNSIHYTFITCTMHSKKNTHKLISIVIQNHKYLLKTKENFIRWFFRGFYFTIYRGLCVCLCVCLRCLYCMPYTVSVELMHDLTVNIVQTVCCLCSVQYLLTECIDAYLPARLCVWNCKKIEMNSKRFVAGI